VLGAWTPAFVQWTTKQWLQRWRKDIRLDPYKFFYSSRFSKQHASCPQTSRKDDVTQKYLRRFRKCEGVLYVGF
jgi:hypothetical protein